MEPSEETSGQPIPPFDQVQALVADEFTIEEGLLDHDTPTFYVKLTPESKSAFLKLMKRLEGIGLVPMLKKESGKYILRIARKPHAKPSRIHINLLLLLATLGTTSITGYIISSSDWVGAVTFTVSLLAILGFHELSHKFAANKHGVEATAPYFIPGLPWPLGIGTFGAVIQQKSLAPNKDALFDIGISGPVIGFIIATIVTVLGFPFSVYNWIPKDSPSLPSPILFFIIGQVLQPFGSVPPYPTSASPGDYILAIILHPVTFAGWIGMFVTGINLVPAGMLDGGHTIRALLGQKAASVLPLIAIIILLVLNPLYYWVTAILAFFFSIQRHPGPLDDVSKLTTSRKIAAVLLIVVFILCIAPSEYFL